MGCSCGYNVHIKTLIITHYFCFLRFHFLTLRSLLVQILQMLYSCLFLSPPSCNLYTCTSQPSSYQSGMSSFTISVKTKPSCSTIPWQYHKYFSYRTPCTKTIHPNLCNQRNKNKSLAPQTQSHLSAFEYFQQAPDPNIIRLQQILEEFLCALLFFCALIENKQCIMSKKLALQWPQAGPPWNTVYYITSWLQAHIQFIQFWWRRGNGQQ